MREALTSTGSASAIRSFRSFDSPSVRDSRSSRSINAGICCRRSGSRPLQSFLGEAITHVSRDHLFGVFFLFAGLAACDFGVRFARVASRVATCRGRAFRDVT